MSRSSTHDPTVFFFFFKLTSVRKSVSVFKKLFVICVGFSQGVLYFSVKIVVKFDDLGERYKKRLNHR